MRGDRYLVKIRDCWEVKQEAKQLDGRTFTFTEGWPSEPGISRVAHGAPKRVDRSRGLGNAIVPQIAYQILRAIQSC